MDKKQFTYYSPSAPHVPTSHTNEEPSAPYYNETPPTYDEAVGGAVEEQYEIATIAPEPDEIGFHELLGGTIKPFPNFNVKEDVEKIRLALTSKDKDLIIQVMCRRSAEQRLEIAQLYNTCYGKLLPRGIKDHIGTNGFGNLISGLSMPLFEYMSRAVHNSSSNFRWMCFIMFILSNRVRQQMANHFLEKYKMDVQPFIKLQIRSNRDHPDKFVIKQIIRVYESVRDESCLVVEKSVLEDVEKISELKNYDSRSNTEVKEVVKNIMYTKSFAHIRAICQEYLKQSGGVSIHDLISETFAHNKFIIFNIINFSINPIQYFVSNLKTHSGILNVDRNIYNSIILLRSEVDLLDIKHEFENVYKISLQDQIRKKCSGFYKYALYELIGEERSDKS